jgi:RNA polymerase sporulation-specific sigma factor
MYFRANKSHQNDVSLSDSIGTDKEGNEIDLMDVIEDKGLDIIEYIYQKDNVSSLKEYLQKLKGREKTIIIKRYGLNGEKELTQKEIAKEMHISRSYVSRIEKRALTKILRNFINDSRKIDK